MGKHTSLEMRIWLDRSNKILSRRNQEEQQIKEHKEQQKIIEKLNDNTQLKKEKIPQINQQIELPFINKDPMSFQQKFSQPIPLFENSDQIKNKQKEHIKPISIKQIKLKQQRDKMILKSQNFFDQEESDFESDSENALDANFENNQRTFTFLLFDSFLQQKNININQLKNLAELRQFDLLTFLNQQIREQNKKKEFQCQYCSKSFEKASALGGHTSKNHPSKSKSYQKRIFSSCIRKIERKRSSFLKKQLNSQK